MDVVTAAVTRFVKSPTFFMTLQESSDLSRERLPADAHVRTDDTRWRHGPPEGDAHWTTFRTRQRHTALLSDADNVGTVRHLEMDEALHVLQGLFAYRVPGG